MSSMRLGKKGKLPGRFSYFSQDVIATVAAGTDVGADGVDDGPGALAHFDGVVRQARLWLSSPSEITISAPRTAPWGEGGTLIS